MWALFDFYRKKNSEANKPLRVRREDRTVSEYDSWKFLRLMVYVGIIFIALACAKALVFFNSHPIPLKDCPLCNPCLKAGTPCIIPPPSLEQNIRAYFSSLGMVLLIAGASFCTGGLLGLLFGIPRFAPSDQNEDSKTKKKLRQNDNLVEISDWITKIIVGVGLTQIYQIPHALWSLGNYLSACFNNNNANDSSAGIVGVVTVLYFLAVGFLTGYVWTRINFSTMLAKNDHNLQSLELQLADKENELIVKEKEVDALSKEFLPFLLDQKNLSENATSNQINSDPHKGKFGGLTENKGRKITATVVTASFNDDFFTVTLNVFSTSGTPLTGEVLFYLHPTFRNPEEKINAINGIATLNILAWGAFTVGIVCDNGTTMLEIDLSEVSSAPKKFRDR